MRGCGGIERLRALLLVVGTGGGVMEDIRLDPAPVNAVVDVVVAVTVDEEEGMVERESWLPLN